MLFIASLGYAQEDEYVYGDGASTSKKTSNSSGFNWDRATVGGGFYAAFGSNSYFLLAPTFGYHLTENFVVGLGANYAYERVDVQDYIPYKSNTYGGSLYSQYRFRELPFLVHAELEYVNINLNFDSEFEDDLTLNLINPYVGGGLQQWLGNYSYFYALILFNLNETKESSLVQQNPVIRIGISIGL
jgi:hypothetical protein